MGIETAFIFNEIQLVDGCLDALREAAIEALKGDDASWTRVLRYLYIEYFCGPIIDLQIDKKLTRELKKSFRTRVVPLSKLSSVASEYDLDEEPYNLKFEPYDGWWFEWRDTGDFAEWLCPFCMSGQLFEYTDDEGGGLWGWEFDEGKLRKVELKPIGRWKKLEFWATG